MIYVYLCLQQSSSLTESQRLQELHDYKPWVTNLLIGPYTLGTLTDIPSIARYQEHCSFVLYLTSHSHKDFFLPWSTEMDGRLNEKAAAHTSTCMTWLASYMHNIASIQEMKIWAKPRRTCSVGEASQHIKETWLYRLHTVYMYMQREKLPGISLHP